MSRDLFGAVTYTPFAECSRGRLKVGDEHSPSGEFLMSEMPVAPPSWRQLGVLVLDGSGSMTAELQEQDRSLEGLVAARTKGEAVHSAVGQLLSRMQASRKAPNFCISMLAFNDRVTAEIAPTELVRLDTSMSFNPTDHGVGGTRLGVALLRAQQIIAEFFSREVHNDLPMSAVVLVMTDGEDHDPAGAVAAAQTIKAMSNTTVAACLFASKGGDDSPARMLEALSSGPGFYQTVYSAEQLRKFFHASITKTVALTGDTSSDV